MKSENEIRSALAHAHARIKQASENITFAKQARQKAVVDYGAESKAWEFWDAEADRHLQDWIGLRLEIRDLEYELNG